MSGPYLHDRTGLLSCQGEQLFRNALKGKFGSIRENLSFLGESSHFFVHSLASLEEYSCFVTEALIGSGVLNIWGRSVDLLDLPCAAAFAILSAASLPFTSL